MMDEILEERSIIYLVSVTTIRMDWNVVIKLSFLVLIFRKSFHGEVTSDLVGSTTMKSRMCTIVVDSFTSVLFWDGNTIGVVTMRIDCLLYTSPSPRDQRGSRMPSSA